MPSLALLTATVAALAPVPADAQATIGDVHRLLAKLIVAKDGLGLQRMAMESFSRDFVQTKADGRRSTLADMWDSAQDEADAKKMGRADGPIKYATRLRNWKRSGKTITVDAHSDVVGEWLKGDRRLPVKFRNLVRETWALEDGRWMALRFDEVWINGSIDGKPFSFKASR